MMDRLLILDGPTVQGHPSLTPPTGQPYLKPNWDYLPYSKALVGLLLASCLASKNCHGVAFCRHIENRTAYLLCNFRVLA
jgi:hypothetical protein